MSSMSFSGNSKGDRGHSSNPVIKSELKCPPSPTFSCATVATAVIVRNPPRRNSKPVSSPSSPVSPETEHKSKPNVPQISVRPLETLLEPEDPTPSNVEHNLSNQFIKPSKSTVGDKDNKEHEGDWRSVTKSVVDRLQYILENDNKYQDVVFEVCAETGVKTFGAHKLILRIASSEFEKMFLEFETSHSNNQTLIKLNNVEPHIFRLLLRFIYTDCVDLTPLTGTEILKLLEAAKTYGVGQLSSECVKILKSGNLSDDIALKLCEIASKHDDKLLLATSFSHIANKAYQIFPSENFLHLSRETISKLIDRNDLRIDELSLFEAVVKWSEFNCMQRGVEIIPENVRNNLEHIIPKIRFPLMTAEEFTLKVSGTQLLTSEEQVQIFQYICVDPSKRGDKLPPISFNTNPRYSEKNLILNEDSLSDYQDVDATLPEESPDRGPSLPSTTNIDYVDFTTEPESETASNISSASEKPRGSRKHGRSSSQSSDNASSRKRHKNEKRIERSASKNNKLNNLFGGDSEPLFTVKDKVIYVNPKKKIISLNSFIDECSGYKDSEEIEGIVVSNVTVDDFKDLSGHKACFDSLKKFYLSFKADDYLPSRDLQNVSLEKVLFFVTLEEGGNLTELWLNEVDITVIVNEVIVFKFSPKLTRHITLNKFINASQYLKSLETKSVKSIVYSYPELPNEFCPSSLKRLVIQRISITDGIENIIQPLKHLKELIIVPLATKSTRPLRLQNKLQSKDKLRKFGLGQFKVYLENCLTFPKLEYLYLWQSSWEPNVFEQKFNIFFPNLKELFLIGPMAGSPRLLKNITRIKTLTTIFSWACDWNLRYAGTGGEMPKFITDCGLSIDEKCFKIRKNSNGEWQGSKITTYPNKCIYENFEYEFLYEHLNGFSGNRSTR